MLHNDGSMKTTIAEFVVLCGVLVSVGAAIARPKEPIRYAAVGDSYTIGTGAVPGECWPAVLTGLMMAKGVDITLVANPAQDGWTTADAIRGELRPYADSHPNFATLMIGVNDTYRGLPQAQFRSELVYLIDAMQKELPGKGRLLIVTIPDYSVTPAGAQFAGMNIGASNVVLFNKIIFEEARKRSLPVFDVYPLTKKMAIDPSLVAADGLHPSAKEYALWAKAIFPLVYDMVRKLE